MARIESETVYNVELDDDEAARLANGGSVTLDLPTGDTIRLGGADADVSVSAGANGTSSGVANEDAADEVAQDDTDLEEIEQLVRESEKEARQNRGPDPDEIPDDAETDDGGNTGGGGIISVERGE